jgi:hypothetical protein
MEGFCSTGQSPQRAVVPVEEEKEEEAEEEEEEEEEVCLAVAALILKIQLFFTRNVRAAIEPNPTSITCCFIYFSREKLNVTLNGGL